MPWLEKYSKTLKLLCDACLQDPRQENTILKIQQVYEELKQLYPDSGKRSGLTLHSALPVESKASSW